MQLCYLTAQLEDITRPLLVKLSIFGLFLHENIEMQEPSFLFRKILRFEVNK